MRHYACTDCERECMEEVHFVEAEGQQPLRAFIACSGGHGRICIEPETLRHWVVDFRGLVASLAELTGTHGLPKESVPQRLWWLGQTPIHGQLVSVYFTRGATWRDWSAVYAGVGELRGAGVRVVLVPGRVPVSETLGAGTKVLTLQQLVSIGPGGLRVDQAAIEQVVPKSRVRVAPHVVPIHTAPESTWGQVMIEFLDEETVRVSVPGQSAQERSFADTGFRDRRKSGEQADLLWEFLRLLAKEQGRLSSEDSRGVISAASFGKVKKWVAGIRERLHTLFPDLAGDPFKPYRTVKAYETEFILRWAGSERQR